MPKQVIQWGKQYTLVHHPETENTSEYWEQVSAEYPTYSLTPHEQVKTWQRFLNTVDYGDGEYHDLDIDGQIGVQTRAAIKSYQKFLNVEADGVWGPITEGAHLASQERLGGRRLTRQPNLEVIWVRPEDRAPVPIGEDPEGHVQIGIDLDAVDLEDRMRYSSNASAMTFYTDRLTRSQINELIRVLKRARNAAFGSDE